MKFIDQTGVVILGLVIPKKQSKEKYLWAGINMRMKLIRLTK
tara:strand:- start:708 stop:833 length:126 start_codon:yes stop_codon:yes gene_type:complete